MSDTNSALYPVRVFDPQGKLKREISRKSVLKHHWKQFSKEGKELSSIKTNTKWIRVIGKLKREIDLPNYIPEYNE